MPPAVNATGASAASAIVTGISLQKNLLSVDVREQDVRQVIESIAQLDNIKVRHLDSVENTRVSARFVSLSMVDGLKRILRAAGISGYVFVTTGEKGQVKVQQILFLPSGTASGATTSPARSRRASTSPSARRTVSSSRRAPAEKAKKEGDENSASVFDDIKANTTARRLLSQLVHPNEQVRDRALERLIRLVGDDEKQAELLDFLEPLMESLASDDQTERNEARAEIRKLLRR